MSKKNDYPFPRHSVRRHGIQDPKMKQFFVYILASKRNGTLYVGMTANLPQRLYQHRHKLMQGFTAKYKINKLVYFEQTSDAQQAIKREKQLKNWHRSWKIELIERFNPGWKDLDPESGLDTGSGSLPVRHDKPCI